MRQDLSVIATRQDELDALENEIDDAFGGDTDPHLDPAVIQCKLTAVLIRELQKVRWSVEEVDNALSRIESVPRGGFRF